MKQPDNKSVLLDYKGVLNYKTAKEIQDLLENEILKLTKSLVSEADAEEITSNTFYKLHLVKSLQLEQFETLDNVKAWLLVCARRKCFDLLRAQQLRREGLERYFKKLQKEINEEPEIEIPPHIQKIISGLPNRLKQVLQSSYRDETDDEIGKRLGIQTKSVHDYRSRALRIIRKELGMHTKQRTAVHISSNSECII